MTLMEGMNAHHAKRLGIAPEAIVSGYRSFVAEIVQGQF